MPYQYTGCEVEERVSRKTMRDCNAWSIKGHSAISPAVSSRRHPSNARGVSWPGTCDITILGQMCTKETELCGSCYRMGVRKR